MADLMTSYQHFPQGVLSLAFAFLISKNDPKREAIEAPFSKSPEVSTCVVSQPTLPAKSEAYPQVDYLQNISMITLQENLSMLPCLQPHGYEYQDFCGHILNQNLENQCSFPSASPSSSSSGPFNLDCLGDWYHDFSECYPSNYLEKDIFSMVDLDSPDCFSCVGASSDINSDNELKIVEEFESPATVDEDHSKSQATFCSESSFTPSSSFDESDPNKSTLSSPYSHQIFSPEQNSDSSASSSIHQQENKKLPALFDVRAGCVVQASQKNVNISGMAKKTDTHQPTYSSQTVLAMVNKDMASISSKVCKQEVELLSPSSQSQHTQGSDNEAYDNIMRNKKRILSDEEEFLLSMVGKTGDEIATLNNPEFHQLIQHITPEHLQKLKDLRRRYKNKRAARNCRAKRAMTFENMKLRLDTLQDMYMERVNVYNFLLQVKQTKNIKNI